MSLREHAAIDVYGLDIEGPESEMRGRISYEVAKIKRALRGAVDLTDRYEVRATTATTITMTDEDDVILIDTTAGVVGVTSPAPSTIPQREFTLKKTTIDANSVTFTPVSGTVDGAASLVFGIGARTARRIFCDGTNFHVL
jgi:hypothetical protein